MNDESKIQNPKSKIAFVFPGQGSQAVGMGRDLFDNFRVAKQIFEEADDALGFKLSEMCFGGTAADLALTENTQPAILTVSIAALRALQSEFEVAPAFAAGHSLGEYSALVAAGALSFTDAVRVVRLRGRFMQEAVPVGAGAMAAVLGADLATVETACREAAENQICSAANLNSPTQIVIAGDAAAIDRAIEIIKAKGAKRAVKLNVSAPFHCALMRPAQIRLAAELEKIEFRDLQFPIVSNVTADRNATGETAKRLLIEQVTAPVRWTETVGFFKNESVSQFIEIGAGKVLSSLIKQTWREAACANVEDSASLQAAQVALTS